jgi:uncharacterized protein (DUF488 family)
MPEVIYTLGYEKRSIEEFVALANAAGLEVLIDVRETAWSHKPGFSKNAFAAALAAAGIEYVHAPFAGNPKWLRANAETHTECLSWYSWYLDEFGEVLDAFEALVSPLLAEDKRTALTCFERHAGDCHRSILAERWAARDEGGRHIMHLATDGCARLVPA